MPRFLAQNTRRGAQFCTSDVDCHDVNNSESHPHLQGQRDSFWLAGRRYRFVSHEQ